MSAEPLSKEIYDKALTMGITKITLNFSGGDGKGCLNVQLACKTDENGNDCNKLIDEIDIWAWEVYTYSGVGDGIDGNAYGDVITYDLVKQTVTTREWYTERQYGSSDVHTIQFADKK